MLIETNLLYNLYYFILFFNGILILITTIFWHELGHLLYFKLVKQRNVKVYYNKDFSVGTNEDYDCLSEPEYKIMLLSGIGFGIIPIIIGGIFNQTYLLIVFGYIYGCWHDIKLLDLKINLE